MENIECMDLMENLRYIDLIDQNDNIRDPPDANDMQLINGGDVMAEELSPLDELGFMFIAWLKLDELGFMFIAWLKSNQPNRWTVGSDPIQSMIKGKRRLLEVVLEWGSCEFPFRYQEHIQDTSFNNNNMIFSSSNNICYQEPNTSPNHNTVCTMAKYHDNVLDSAHTCPASDSYLANDNCFNNNSIINSNGKYSNSTGQGCVETANQVKNQYCYPTGTDSLVKLRMLITKAARKKRMEQRSRVLSKKNHYDCNRQIHNLSQNQNVNQQCRHGKANQANQDDRQARGWKSEKKLTLLLQKVLTRSDANLGKIVLPKKEAETYLPELSISRNRIPISVKDVETSSVWNMHYRFWPNNNARMYILENTGGFVQDNLLQEEDIIMMYTDIKKNNKYFIRGVKRDKGIKISTKKPTKTHRSHGNNSCLPKSIH